jgi:ubiquinone/menaquinone biosynthesis C-methylase UbiE
MGWLERWRRGKPRGAACAEVRAYFERAAADEANYPAEIDPRILHVRFVLEHLGALGRGRAADIGSGKGRFARLVKQHNPEATVIAVDIAEAMLKRVPAGIARVAASMTQVPLASESLDAAFAIESLEHAVDIEAAVAELGRILRPGGRVAIIDKNARQWGRLPTPAWERWFGQQELAGLLRRHFRQVDSQPISYWEDVPADGLFLAWRAIK